MNTGEIAMSEKFFSISPKIQKLEIVDNVTLFDNISICQLFPDLLYLVISSSQLVQIPGRFFNQCEHLNYLDYQTIILLSNHLEFGTIWID